MEDRDHHDPVLLGKVEDAVWEPSGQGTPNLAVNGRELERRPADPLDCSLDACHERLPQAGAALLVPSLGLLELGLSLVEEDDRMHHRPRALSSTCSQGTPDVGLAR